MQDLGTSIIAEILGGVALFMLGWLCSIALRLPSTCRRRRDLFQFFGLTKGNPKLTVFFSTLFIPVGGSVDFRGTPRTFEGPAIPAAELAVVQPVSQFFFSPFLRGLPAPIRKWLGDKVHWTCREIHPVFSPSPGARSEVEPGNMLTVGSRYYNAAGDLYASTGDPFLEMEQQIGSHKMVIRVRKGRRKGDEFEQRPNRSDDLAIVEKLFDDAHKTTVFIAAGLGVVGTRGAVQYLVDNWARLHKEYGTEPFGVCLRFQEVASDPSAYKKPVELSQFR